MSTETQLKQEMQSLATKAERLLDDRTKSMAIKSAEYKRIKADLEAKAHELHRLENTVIRPRDIEAWGSESQAGDSYNMPSAFGAPPLIWSNDDIKALYEAVSDHKSLSLRAEGKAAISTTEAPMAAIPMYDRSPFPFLRDRVRVLDALPSVGTQAPSVTYYKLTTGAVNAATVAEGATKPTSNPIWSTATATVRKIAHVASLTDEVQNDFPTFTQFIGDEMLGGLIDVENAQLLAGDGTGTNILGLNNTAGILTRARSTDSQLDALAKAMTDVRTGSSFLEPDLVIMHPTDFLTIRLAKASGSGEYLASDPLSSQSNNIWGIPTKVTTKQPVGTALVGNMAASTKVYVREAPRLETSRGGAAEFAANVSLIRAEERLALTVIRPTAICKVTGL